MKNKILLLAGLISIGVTNAMADVTFDSGKFSGSIDLNPFMSASAIVITAIAVFFGVRKAIGLFK